MDRFEPSAETAALHAVMVRKPEEAKRILNDSLLIELSDLYGWLSELRDMITEEFHKRGAGDVQ